MEKLIERALPVVRKRGSIDEAAPAIKTKRGLEVRSTACFETEPHHPSLACNADDVLEKHACHSAAEKIRVRAHGLELPRVIAKILECTDARDRIPRPDGPHGDIAGSETGV